ncbi:MAG TPA: hypothetical protein DCZ56_07825 [Sutterella sp.]|nr:hypothetical protein [Sutterella sp.]
MISVIVPVYGVEPYLDKCVSSILSQTYRDLEIILVDDESPDNCPAMCDTWAKNDPRITVIHKKHGGLSDARNAGIEQAHGDFLTFVDSDDYLAPNMCERLLKVQIETGADVVVCNYVTIQKTGEGYICPMPIRSNPLVVSGRNSIAQFFTHRGISFVFPVVVAWGKLYHRKLFLGRQPLRYPYGRTYEDNYVFYQWMLAARNIAFISDALYLYVKRDGSITDSFDISNFADQLAISTSMVDWAKNLPADDRLLIEHGAYLRFFTNLANTVRIPRSAEKKRLIQETWSHLQTNTSAYLQNPYAGFRSKVRYLLYKVGLLHPLRWTKSKIRFAAKWMLRKCGLFAAARALRNRLFSLPQVVLVYANHAPESPYSAVASNNQSLAH